MSSRNSSVDSVFLRRVLAADAVACAAMGIMMIVATGWLSASLDLPAELLRGTGWVLLPFAAMVALLATRTQPARLAVQAVIAVNAIWVVESFFTLRSDLLAPNLMGSAFIGVQALAVAVLAILEVVGLRRFAAETLLRE